MCTQLLGCIHLFATPWTVACQAPLSMRFFQARILEQIAISTKRNLPDTGIETVSLASPHYIL